MLKKILVGLGVVVAVFLGVVATRPAAYHVERSMPVNAPADAVFATVNDYRTFPSWSPWAKRDPAIRTSISSPSAGVGASYAWEGNKEVGKGRMTITESTPPSRVRERLEFIEPFQSVADTGFDVKAQGAGSSVVTWSIDGTNNFIGKAFSLFMDMDKMLGKDFEEGLAGIKRLAESRSPAAPAQVVPAAPAAPIPAH